MEILRPHGENGENGVNSPMIEIRTELGRAALHWLNCRVRTFAGNEQFNHVEFQTDEGQLVAFQQDELMEILKQYHFPHLELPYVDGGTFNWMTERLSRDLDAELEGLEDE